MKIESLETIRKTAREFIETVIKQGSGRVFLFYGSMGAGKTTFIRAICEELGVEESVNSPTFAIVNEYRSGEGDPIYHFDFYRINKEEEAYDFGYEDYFYSGELCFVEWPEKIENLLPEDAVTVSITELPDGTREVAVGKL
jgi:tRNA threonylcarbamoyladenosine biosynthesis protein TsaE